MNSAKRGSFDVAAPSRCRFFLRHQDDAATESAELHSAGRDKELKISRVQLGDPDDHPGATRHTGSAQLQLCTGGGRAPALPVFLNGAGAPFPRCGAGAPRSQVF